MIWAQQRATDGGTLLLEETFAYDALGNRIQQQTWTSATGWVVTNFAYDGEDVFADLDGSYALQTRYVRPDGVDALGSASSAEPCRGSTPTTRDQCGSSPAPQVRCWTRSTTTPGATRSARVAPPDGSRYGYTGKEWDGNLGLQYNVDRYYNPVAGIWTTQDPDGFEAGDSNLNRYVQNGRPTPPIRRDAGCLSRTVKRIPSTAG